jgi:hypothetical protein
MRVSDRQGALICGYSRLTGKLLPEGTLGNGSRGGAKELKAGGWGYKLRNEPNFSAKKPMKVHKCPKKRTQIEPNFKPPARVVLPSRAGFNHKSTEIPWSFSGWSPGRGRRAADIQNSAERTKRDNKGRIETNSPQKIKFSRFADFCQVRISRNCPNRTVAG